MQLQPVQFNWNNQAAKIYNYSTEPVQTGLIAQEVENIIPEWVVTKPDGYKKIPGSGNLQYVLVNAIKELQTPYFSLPSPKPIKILTKLGWQMASHFLLLLLAKFGVIPKPILLVILVFFS